MRLKDRWVEGRFLARDNRFRVTVEIDGRSVWAHLPNPGRLEELLLPGRRVILVERPGPRRLTHYDLALIEADRAWVSLDTRLPNDLVHEALAAGGLPSLLGYTSVRREVPYGASRLDFLLEADDRVPCLVEVKSATLIVDGLACFPDAVTTRGRRHVEELAGALAHGYRAMVFFVVQREDARGLRPYDETDAEFGRALRQAAERGVEIEAWACHVEPGAIAIQRRLPVCLDPAP